MHNRQVADEVVGGKARARPPSQAGPWLFASVVFCVLGWGWSASREQYIVAESGLGYALGVVGGLTMLLLGAYPLRKRARFMRHWAALRHWFRVHMILGIIGPVCILFHANFGLGSTNSNVALICMLVVAGSGVAGRYAYGKIHHGLYGRRASLAELRLDSEASREKLAVVFRMEPRLRRLLKRVEEHAMTTTPGLVLGAVSALSMGPATRLLRIASVPLVVVAFRSEARRARWSAAEVRLRRRRAHRHLARYLASLRRVSEFAFYERVFALWHVFHIPLSIMLLITGVVHVIAVHMY